MLTMELSADTIEGLINIQDENNMPEEIFSQILDVVISHVCKHTEPSSITKVSSSKPDATKSAFAHISCLFVEAARHNLDAEGLNSFLNSEHINGLRAQRLLDVYVSNKEEIQSQLELTGNSLPHVVDIHWRLDYCIKSDAENSIGLPLYNLQLSAMKHGKLDKIMFSCTIQQLQELVYKLKDAARHVEKIAVT